MHKYTFKSYSPIFPHLFQKEKERICSHVQKIADIQHVGSTAVPGLGGKGIIDIAISATEVDTDVVTQQLQEIGYEYRLAYSTSDRRYFVAFLPDPEEQMRRYHIHLTYPESDQWKGLIGFRDYLRGHPEAVKEYSELKRKAVIEANQDGDIYRKIKDPIFRKLLRSAEDEKKRDV